MLLAESAQRVEAFRNVRGVFVERDDDNFANLSKVLDGQSYWMINAPTIFGNSGGAIYLSETHEMLAASFRSIASLGETRLLLINDRFSFAASHGAQCVPYV